MEELNVFQRILFTLHSIVIMIIMFLGIYLLFFGLFLFTGKVLFLSLIPLWFALDYYKHSIFQSLGYTVKLSGYELKKTIKKEVKDADESDKVEE